MKEHKHPKKGRLKYLGAWVSKELYTKLKTEAAANHRSVSGELKARLAPLIEAR
jgi:hypothetical protein